MQSYLAFLSRTDLEPHFPPYVNCIIGEPGTKTFFISGNHEPRLGFPVTFLENSKKVYLIIGKDRGQCGFFKENDWLDFSRQNKLFSEHVLDGSFAIIGYDFVTGMLFGIVDRFRSIPLYVWSGPEGVAVTTSIELFKSLFGSRCYTLNPIALHHYLSTGTILAPTSILQSFITIPAGHWYMAGLDECSSGSYWHFQKSNSMNDSIIINHVWDNLTNAVERSVEQAEKPINILLSSGLDSSTIARICVDKLGKDQVRAVTIGFQPSIKRDEQSYARDFCNLLGIHHEICIIKSHFFWDNLINFIRTQNQPSFDGLNSFFAIRFADELMSGPIIAGHGVDELFGSYRTFRIRGWDSKHQVEDLRYFCEAFARTKFPSDLSFSSDFQYEFERTVYGPWLRQNIRGHGGGVVDTLMKECAYTGGFYRRPFQLMQLLERKVSLSDRVMPDNANSLLNVGRIQICPFLDHRLWEYVTSLPAEIITPNAEPKGLFKRSVARFLPNSTINREKAGFEIPLFHWLITEAPEPVNFVLKDSWLASHGVLNPDALDLFIQELRSMDENHAQANSRSYKLWMIIALELWIRLVHEPNPNWEAQLKDILCHYTKQLKG